MRLIDAMQQVTPVKTNADRYDMLQHRRTRILSALRTAAVAGVLTIACGARVQAFSGNTLGFPVRDTTYQDTTARVNRTAQTSAPSAGASDAPNTNFSHERGQSESESGSNFSGAAESASSNVPLPAPPTPMPAEERSRIILQNAHDANARRLLFATAARIDAAVIRPYDRMLLTADVTDEAAAAAVPLLQFDRVAEIYRNEKRTDHPADWWELRAVSAALVFQETIDLPNRAATVADMNASADLFASGAARVRAMTTEFMRIAGTNLPAGCEKTRDALVRFGETVNFLLDTEKTFVDTARTQPQLSIQSIPGQNAMGAIRSVMNQQNIASSAGLECTKIPDTVTIFQLQQALAAMRIIGDAKK